MLNYTLTQITPSANLNDFDCGEEELNDFLINDALRNQQAWLSATYLLHHEDMLLGFFTIIPDTLQKGHIAEFDRLTDYPYSKYPAIKLARIAVDSKYQRQGVGTELMLQFFKIALKIVEQGGGRYITVDAKKPAIGFYESFGFHKVESKKNLEYPSLYLDFYRLNKILDE